MKKVLFAAIAVCGFVVANAQDNLGPAIGGGTIGNPQTPIAALATDQSTASINVKIVKTINITPDAAQSYAVTFDKPAQFGNFQSAGENKWTIYSTDNGRFNVSFDRGSIPAAVEMKYSVLFSNENSVGAIASQPTSTAAGSVFTATAGGTKVAVPIDVKVPWGVASGNYAGTLTITATAN